MPTYVYYQGELIDKNERPASYFGRSELPAPTVISFDAYASPVDGQTISSHRQREKDLQANGCYDPRDTPPAYRKAQDVRYKRRSSAE